MSVGPRAARGLGQWAQLADRLPDACERSAFFESVGRRLARAFAAFVGPGRVKDALSGTWMGHPAHPMLTDLTVGAWTCSFVLDLLPGKALRDASDTLVAVGIASAVPTAITGLNDLADAEAPGDKGIGAAHATGNTLALVLYAISLAARRNHRRGFGYLLSTLGAGALTVSAFLGGHLAYRRGLGVDHGRFEAPPEEWTRVLQEADLPEGKAVRVRVDRADVLLYREGGRILAIGNRCSHRGGPLHKGAAGDGTVTCPWHLSTFSLEDGAVLRGPATAPQRRYEVRVRDGQIELHPSPSPATRREPREVVDVR